MKVDDIGVLEHLYFGSKIYDADMSYLQREMDRGFSGNPFETREKRGFSLDLVPQEYSGSGVGDYRVNAVELVSADGSRSCDFRYRSHKIYDGKYALDVLPYVRENKDQMQTLEICLEDAVIGAEVTLFYGVLPEKDVITRSVCVSNMGHEKLILKKAASLCVDLPYADLDLIHFHGRHCMERQPERIPVGHEIQVIESRRGMSSHHHNPFVILCDHSATEHQGECYGFMLMYSGNHRTEIEKDQTGSIRIVSGINPGQFEWKLEAGEMFTAPESIISYSDKGLNGLSRNYHHTIRENVCPEKYLDERRPVLINNWEATYFDFDEQKILNLAEQARELGIEMFVLDDGWFGKRDDDNSGLGDWYVNEKKLPGGLKKIVETVNGMGLKFGLWFEPEMINEDSDLYRSHPDWVLKDPGRKPVMARNQMVLDMSRKDVVEYLFTSISAVLKSVNIEYIKWDFNRSVSNVYSNFLPKERQGETAHRFMLGTYSLMERLSRHFPDVMIEGCAGGGGRFDAGILFYSPQIWCSDDTDPIQRLKIQKGTSYGYPVSAVGSHVSARRNHQTGRETTMETRGVVAMSGTFGYELDLNQLSEKEKEEIKKQIEDFKKYYWLIQKGDYYRLEEGQKENYYTAWQFVSDDRSETLLNLVVMDVHANQEFPHVKLKGLDPQAMYELEGSGECFLGQALMKGGYTFDAMSGVYPARQLHFVRL